jgi:hypothetical protein
MAALSAVSFNGTRLVSIACADARSVPSAEVLGQTERTLGGRQRRKMIHVAEKLIGNGVGLGNQIDPPGIRQLLLHAIEIIADRLREIAVTLDLLLVVAEQEVLLCPPRIQQLDFGVFGQRADCGSLVGLLLKARQRRLADEVDTSDKQDTEHSAATDQQYLGGETEPKF